MRVIEPITVTESMLLSSTVSEPDASMGETAYSGAATYNTNDLAVLNHLLYRSLIDSNTGNSPDVSPNEWLLLGSSNKFRPFYYLTNNRSTGATPYVIEVAPGQKINTIVVTGAVGVSIRVRAIRPGDIVVYDQTRDLVFRETTGWFSYWFGEFDVKDKALFQNIPPVPDAVFEVTITGTGDVGLVNLIFGLETYIGSTQYGSGDDALDFSTITRDQFGNTTLKPGRVVPTLLPPVFANKGIVPIIRRLRTRTAGRATVWIGVDDPNDAYFESHFVFGIWRRFRIDIDYPNNARIDLELENL